MQVFIKSFPDYEIHVPFNGLESKEVNKEENTPYLEFHLSEKPVTPVWAHT